MPFQNVLKPKATFFFSSDLMSRRQRDSIYKAVKHRKAENPHISKAGSITFMYLLLVKKKRSFKWSSVSHVTYCMFFSLICLLVSSLLSHPATCTKMSQEDVLVVMAVLRLVSADCCSTCCILMHALWTCGLHTDHR